MVKRHNCNETIQAMVALVIPTVICPGSDAHAIPRITAIPRRTPTPIYLSCRFITREEDYEGGPGIKGNPTECPGALLQEYPLLAIMHPSSDPCCDINLKGDKKKKDKKKRRPEFRHGHGCVQGSHSPHRISCQGHTPVSVTHKLDPLGGSAGKSQG